MIVVFITLAALVMLGPVLGMLNPIWAIGVASAILAAALMIMAIALPVNNLNRFTRLLRPALLFLAAPALCMFLQVIPVPWRGLANPIWASASAALNQRFSGAITVDIGATLLSLAQYVAVIAAAVLTAAVTLDRQRAMHILHLLMVITALVAARQIVLALAPLPPPPLADSSDGWAQASVIATVGLLLSCAVLIQSIDQLKRVSGPRRSRTRSVLILSGAILSFLTCATTILIRANPAVVMAALIGTGTLAAVFAIRRWFLGLWGAAALAAAAVIGLFGALTLVPVNKHADLTIGFSDQAHAATDRMLSDIRPIGYGAGTFEALVPVYQGIDETASREHPTAAAAITIEMGRIFFCSLIIVALFGAWTLFNRSLSRGHDYVYAAAGAGALVSLPMLTFVNNGLLNFGVSFLLGVFGGLAFGQSLSGATRDIIPLEFQGSSVATNEPRHKAQSAASPFFDRRWPRVALAIFGLLLAEQAAWILFAERYTQNKTWSSIKQEASTTGASRDQIAKAAAIARFRGDLWAESGFSLVAQLPTSPGESPDRGNRPYPALLSAFTNALRYSPHRGDVWLTLAAIATRYKLAGYDAGALLKMSYYTAPNELALIPERLRVALSDDSVLNDPELREMIKRDIGLVISRKPALRPVLLSAYRSASPDGKAILESQISRVDPGLLKTIRAQYP